MPDYTPTTATRVDDIVRRAFEDACERFDDLEARHGISPTDVLKRLKESGESDFADYYEDWCEESANNHVSTMGEVPDPGNAPSYDALGEHLRAVEATRKAARGELSDEPGKVWKLTGPNSVSSPGE